MNIHEHQAKELLRKFGAPVPNGIAVYNLKELKDASKKIKTSKIVLKAQIHAGGRGKVGGVKVVNNFDELKEEASELFGKVLVTHQTGPEGREVKRLYLEDASEIAKEFYLSCLVDRTSSKIAFISSAEGGMDIEEVASKTPEKIVTIRLNITDKVSDNDVLNILKPYKLKESALDDGKKIIQALYQALIKTDANLIEVNPLILTKDNKVIGCMVNGAGLAMATMDIINLYGSEPANFLDVGGGASKEKVSAAFKIILSDKNVKGILINIFGGIMKCDVIAEGVIAAAKETELNIPLVVRLAGTNFEKGKEILNNSELTIIPADDLNDAAKKIVEAIK